MRARWKVFVACTAVAMIQSMDVAMITVALPSIGDRFSAELADLQWVVAATALALVSILPTGGAFGDLYGRRKVLLVGYGFLLAGALVGWMAQSMAVLIPARLALGVGMALGFPNSLALMALSFSPEVRGRAVAVWTVMAAAMFAISPIAGGALVAGFGFNSVFIPLFLMAAVGMIGTVLWMPPDRPIRERSLDLSGILLGSGALTLLSYGLIEGGRGGFGRFRIVSVVAIGLILSAWFVRHESRFAHPMLDFRFVRSQSIRSILMVTFVLYAATNAVIFLMTIYLQALRGLSPWETGLVMSVFSVAMLAGAPIGAYMQDRVGFRMPVGIMLPVLVVAALLLSLAGPGTRILGYVSVGLALIGMLNGVFFVVSSATSVTTAPDGQSAAAAASLPAARQLSGVFGIALSGVLATVVTRARIRTLLPGTEEKALQISEVSFGVTPDGIDQAVRAASVDASYFGYSVVMGVIALAALVVAWLVLNLLRSKPSATHLSGM